MNTRDPMAEDASLNAEHPWLGLVSFTEGLSGYFHGREEEVAELARRVQRKTLTILFGQSGLGKTSILNAGVVPRLRGQGFCPVYVRIDYAEGAPSPSEQIKQAVLRETRAHGQWTQIGIAREGESLWEFLHHRDDLLHDAEGRPVLPLLIFDQFEELFTLAQTDEAGRTKAALFVADLADLVENRAPSALESRMLEDDEVAERFDFSRNDYRVLISLREDYLAPLEGLKSQMPSVTQNRMRLAPMTGTQAMAAVRGPGGHLVSEEVAAAIVRFVAGGSELVNAEVEPSLLSLICKELNDARIEKGQREITVDLLAGSHAAILSDFYERALADQPAQLRAFIEDVLLTESGYRENVAEERVRREFATAGAAPDALALLVNRRLLRIEERLDLRRVELTHDVLCSVVSASREARREREARELAQAQAAALAQRARDARHQLRRARRVAAVCVVLTIGAVGSSIYAYWSSQRAKAAEALANQSRTQAEGLLTFLLDDFFQELEPLGRLDIVLQLSQRAVDYYKNLPEALRDEDTERNYALALLRHGATFQSQNRMKEGEPPLAEAIQRLQALQAAGDHSNPTTLGLGLALRIQSRQFMQNSNFPAAMKAVLASEQLLRVPASAPGADRAARLLLGQTLQYKGFVQVRLEDFEPATSALREAQQIAQGLLKADPQDERANYLGLSATPWLMEALLGLGRDDEFGAAARDGLASADALLERRPGHRSALAARGNIYSFMGESAGERMRLAESQRLTHASIADWVTLTRNDPSNGTAWNNLAVAYFSLHAAAYESGQLREAAKSLGDAGNAIAKTPTTAFTLTNAWYWQALRASELADAGDRAGSDREMAGFEEKTQGLLKSNGPPARTAWIKCSYSATKLNMGLLRGELKGVLPPLQAALSKMLELSTLRPEARSRLLDCEGFGSPLIGEILVRQGEFAEAEKAMGQTVALFGPKDLLIFQRQRDVGDLRLWLALSQARQGKLDQARQSLAPALKLHNELVAKSSESAIERFRLAQALYVQAQIETQDRSALLASALKLVAALPPELRATVTVRRWQGWIQGEQQPGKGA